MRGSPPTPYLSRIAMCVCVGLTLCAPLARGGVDLTTEVAVLVLAAVAAACAGFESPLVPRPTLALAAVLGWMTLQLLPIPTQAHGLSPGTASVFQLSLSELGRYPAARPLALDLPGGSREVAKATVCLLLLFASAACADSEQRRAALQRVLAISAVVVAWTVLGAALVGVGSLLAPSFPFVNSNHLAGFLELTGFLVLGQALQARRAARALWAVCFTTVVAVLMTTLSRGGIIAFLLGTAVFAAWTWRRHLVPEGTRALLALGSVCAGLISGALLALSPVVDQLATLRATSTSLKMDLWPHGVRLLRDHALLGIGRGAFPTVFQTYRDDFAQVTYTYLENEWLQALIDLGIPFGLLLLGTLAWIWVAAARRAASVVEVGLLVGMLCLGAHSLFDFSVELLGVGVPFSVGLGILMHGTRPLRVPRVGLVVVVIALCLVGLVGQLLFMRAEARLSALATSPVDRVMQDGSAVAAERPADYLPHAIVGVRLERAGRCNDALPWLRRAMLLSPMAPETHASLGRCLARGPFDAEARHEFALAVSLGHKEALRDAVRIWPSLEDLYRIAGNTPDALLALAEALVPDRGPDAQLALARLHAEFLDDRAALPLARVALRNGDLSTALLAARDFQRAAPNDPEGYKVAGYALAAQGDSNTARQELQRGLQHSPGSAVLLEVLVAWAIKDQQFTEARQLANQVALRSARDLATRHTLLAKILLAQARLLEAIGELEAATVATPGDPYLFMFLAQTRERAGQTYEAIAALERAAALHSAPREEIATRLARLRRRDVPGKASAADSSTPGREP